MRLILKREQILDPKLEQGATFRSFARLELTDHEKELIGRYKIDQLEWIKIGGQQVSITHLSTTGLNSESQVQRRVVEREASILKGCREMKVHLEALSSFSGESVIEI